VAADLVRIHITRAPPWSGVSLGEPAFGPGEVGDIRPELRYLNEDGEPLQRPAPARESIRAEGGHAEKGLVLHAEQPKRPRASRLKDLVENLKGFTVGGIVCEGRRQMAERMSEIGPAEAGSRSFDLRLGIGRALIRLHARDTLTRACCRRNGSAGRGTAWSLLLGSPGAWNFSGQSGSVPRLAAAGGKRGTNMGYQFTNKRNPKTVEELSAPEREQLHMAWKLYAGEDRSASELITENSGWFELWTVEQDGRPVFDYWHMPPDSGTLFYTGEAAPTGIQVIQFGWDVPAPETPTKPGVNLKLLAKELSRTWRTMLGWAPEAEDDDDEEPDWDGPRVLVASKEIARRAVRSAVGKKAAPRKVAPRKAAPRKVAPKKLAPKKVAPKKVAPKKVAPKKAAPKKAAPKKAAPKKAAPKKTGGRR